MVTDSPGQGTVFASRYRIEREIGRGGMATVYLARDLRHQADVAVKVMREDVASAVGADRFSREIQVTANLRHPNIVGIFDSGVADGVPFYVMPYIEGESLEDRLRREGPLPIDEAVRIAAEVSDALSHAHTAGFIHRDVKPANILLFHGRAMLSDFGIARAVEPAGTGRLTETGLALGTANYMSPEQAAGEKIDGRSDVYSLACVMYEMLTGSPPFTGSSTRSVIARHALDPVPSMRSVRQTIPAALDNAVLAGLAKLPVDRQKDAAEFKTAITRSAPDTPRRGRNLLRQLLTSAAAAAVLVTAYTTQKYFTRSVDLQANKVMVFPLSVSVGGLPATIGEDIASVIGNRLDETGGLRWIDAWPMLDAQVRDSIRTLSETRMVELARQRGCRFFVFGRLTGTPENEVRVVLYLADALTRGTDPYFRTNKEGPPDEVLRTSMVAINELLPSLLNGRPPEAGTDWLNRDPAAVANFLLGESAFRRAQIAAALEHYRDAIARDSTFTLAAIRGAQAATWNHRPAEAAQFITTASRSHMPLRYEHFVRGYGHYLAGNADSAAAEFNAAIDIDNEMVAAWMQLGETYTHLLTRSGSPDSLASAAFEEAQRIDPEAKNALFHLVQLGARRGDPRTHDRADQFLRSAPDSVLAAQVRIIDRCARGEIRNAEWEALAATVPFPLLAAANALDGPSRHADCAESAYRALLRIDTVPGNEQSGRSWAAVSGLTGILVSSNRSAEALDVIEKFNERWGFGEALVLYGAPWDSTFHSAAWKIADDDARQFGNNWQELFSAVRLWELGIVFASNGDATTASAIHAEIARRAQNDAHRFRPMGMSVQARIDLARGDTVSAIARLDSIIPPRTSGDNYTWFEDYPLGGERLLLARLLAARGDNRAAIAIADVLDSAVPIFFGMLTRASLELRSSSASAMGDEGSVTTYESRLKALDRTQARTN